MNACAPSCIPMHAHKHTYTHAHTCPLHMATSVHARTHTPTSVHTIHTCTHTCTHTHVPHECTHPQACTHIPTCIHTYSSTHICMHTHIHKPYGKGSVGLLSHMITWKGRCGTQSRPPDTVAEDHSPGDYCLHPFCVPHPHRCRRYLAWTCSSSG